MSDQKMQKRAPRDVRGVALAGFGIVFLAFGAVGGWAATAPLGSAVIGMGTVVGETNKKTVQHFEGGIIAKINVREGDHVKAGDVLFTLDSVQPQATYDIYRNQLLNALAQEARLVAEQQDLPEIKFPEEWSKTPDDPFIKGAMADQLRQFKDRRGSLEGQIGLLRSQMVTLRTEIDGLLKEQAGKQRQVAFLDDEISTVSTLLKSGLALKPRLSALERERASIEGQIGRAVADQAKAENNINEAELKIGQLKQQFFEQAIKDLVEIRTKLSDLRERTIVARDVLRRLDVVSPVTGTVQGLQVFTIGAVVRAGQPLVDVVPDDDKLVIQAQFLPSDASHLVDSTSGGSPAGVPAEVRFTSIHNRVLPMIPGTIRSVSRDRLVDEAKKEPYYLAVVVVDQKHLPPELKGRLMPGLPAEVIVPTSERTVVQYLAQPLMNTLRRTMREK